MTTIKINKEWEFHKGNFKNIQDPFDVCTNWETVNIPHTWNSKDVQNGGGKKRTGTRHAGYFRGTGWYRKQIYIDNEWIERRIFIRFNAVGSVAKVYLNGEMIAEHFGAFSAFCIEITDLVEYGRENLIAVEASNSWRKDLPPLSGDFPVMGGIYRSVELVIKEKVCISPLYYASSGVYLDQTSVNEQKANITARVLVSNSKNHSVDVDVHYTVFVMEKVGIFSDVKSVTLPANSTEEVQISFEIEEPHLWNGREDPFLYRFSAEVYNKESFMLDSVSEPLGLRYYHVDPKSGFYLNGKPYRLNGVCRHQDRLDKGWAISEQDQNQDFQLIYDMGVRGVRLAHYQHSDYFYSLCDKGGILVWAEISLVNEITCNEQFAENARQMLHELIHQNYNHPSIFCWGLGNELGMRMTQNYIPLITELHKISKNEDPNRLTTLAVFEQRKNNVKLHTITDIIGFNTYPGWYYKKIEKTPQLLEKLNLDGGNRGLSISEYGAGASVYHHEKHPKNIKTKGKWHPEEYQNIVHEGVYSAIKNAPFVWGSFLWNMFNFSSPWRDEGDKPGINDKGLVTYDRKIRKDAYFFYKSNWNPDPMVYITSRRFTARFDPEIEVKVYSNCEKVVLFCNKEKIGELSKEENNIFKYKTLKIQKGTNTIAVKGYIDGKIASEDHCDWTLS